MMIGCLERAVVLRNSRALGRGTGAAMGSPGLPSQVREGRPDHPLLQVGELSKDCIFPIVLGLQEWLSVPWGEPQLLAQHLHSEG